MRSILFFLALIIYNVGYGQESILSADNSSLSQSAVGYISVPSLMSIQVNTNFNNIKFDDPLDFKSGKYYTGFLNMKVVSTQPWLVSMKTIAPTFTPLSQGASANMPVSVMRLKKVGSDTWVPLSNNTKPLLYSSNNNISNTFNYDAHFDLGWKYRSGNYTTTIIFTLSPQ